MDLKELTNNQKRKEFLEDYTGWDIWLDVPDVSERYYEYPLPDGSMIVIKETEHTKMDDMMRTAIEALEKQLPKKPQTSKAYYGCPDCTTIRSLRQKHNYCHNCGQRLDWSE